jgi:omega-6 fatty acid desaturase (delta-12 desaturase)
VLAQYREPSLSRSIAEIVVTALPFLLFWAASIILIDTGRIWGLVFTLPAAAFLVRLFVIQHDCGHGSLFSRRWANDWVGRVIGVFTLTPYDHWRKTHAIHHASSGNLDKRGTGDVMTLTVDEYLGRSWLGRLGYRVYRHPLIVLVVGPIYLFLVHNRLPFGMPFRRGSEWLSTMATNLALGLLIAAAIWWFGIDAFLVAHLPIILLAAVLGGWLFFVQHQFEGTSWQPDLDWDFADAALNGSSHYDLPGVLRWLSGNVGIHHIHHLTSRIPFYRLARVLKDYPELAAIGRVSILQSLRCIPLSLWDQSRGRLVSFGDVRRRQRLALHRD